MGDFHKSLGAGVDLSKTKYSIFGLGDSAYYSYCKAAKEIDELMSKCGAQQIVDTKVVKCDGDASAGQGWEPAFEEWSEELWKQLGTPAPKEAEGVLPPQMIYNVSPDAMLDKRYEPPHSVPVEVVKVDHITPDAKPMPDGRIRDFVHVVFKQAGGAPLKYALGDSLMLYPSNDSAEVDKFLRTNYPDLASNLVLNIKAGPNSKGMLDHVPAESTLATSSVAASTCSVCQPSVFTSSWSAVPRTPRKRRSSACLRRARASSRIGPTLGATAKPLL